MGTRQARRLRRVDRAHQRYVGTLLALGLPRRMLDLTAKRKDAPITLSEPRFDWDCPGWRGNIAQFYLDSFGDGTPPGTKAQKRFVRGFVSWCRKEVFDRSEYEDYRFHGVTGRRRK
ncbi:MAG: hypothetical protein KAJ55_17120 [Anaerolineales bacterium]|nr:hypothetical protein [Anaerolineales bacterium]